MEKQHPMAAKYPKQSVFCQEKNSRYIKI